MWALAFIWLFLRTQSLIPLIAVHCAWDLVATFGPHWPAVTGLALLVTLTLFAVAVISWLVERIHDDRKASPSPLAPPAEDRFENVAAASARPNSQQSRPTPGMQATCRSSKKCES